MDIRRSKSSALLRLTQNLIIPAFILSLMIATSAVFMPAGAAYASESGNPPQFTEFEPELFNTSFYEGDLFRPKRVIIRGSDFEIQTLTYAETVGEAIEEIGVSLDLDDKTVPLQGDPIIADTTVTITFVNSEIEKTTEDIDYEVEYITDNSMYIGEEKVLTQGVLGVRTQRYLVTYHDGEVVNREMFSNQITEAPVNKVIARGTKMSGPASCSYWDNVIDSKTSNPTERYWLKYVMRCESACNPNQVSRSGAYHGLYQFSKTTYYNARGGENIYDGSEQIKWALYMFRNGAAPQNGGGAWPICNAGAWRNMPDY